MSANYEQINNNQVNLTPIEPYSNDGSNDGEVPIQTPVTTVEQLVGENGIVKRSVMLNIYMGLFGTSKSVNSRLFTLDTDQFAQELLEGEGEIKQPKKKNTKHSKKLLNSPTLDRIRRIHTETKKKIKEICLPSFVRGGVMLVPVLSTQALDKFLKEQKDLLDLLIDDFIAEYIQLTRTDEGVASLIEELGPLYNPNDYPDPAIVRAKFTFQFQFLCFETPENLKQISLAFFEQQREKNEGNWVAINNEVQQLLRAQVRDIVEHMCDKLAGEEDDPSGKPKTFRAPYMRKIQDFLTDFQLKNITNDQELERTVSKARQLLSGINPKDLRSNDALRDSVVRGFEEIKNSMSSMVIERPKRALKL